MLFRSGDNLEKGAIDFVSEYSEVTVFSAYLKVDELKRINHSNHIRRVVVRWEIKDLCIGVSDFEELFEYCVAQGITLYRNTRIHLKTFWNGRSAILFGSANITGKGLGERNKYNFELNGMNEQISFRDKLYLSSLITSGEIVDEELFEKLSARVSEYPIDVVEYREIETVPVKEDKFLLSQLPMSVSPNFLINALIQNIELSFEDEDCLVHDCATFELGKFKNPHELEKQVKDNFNKHPFIVAFKNYLTSQDDRSLSYGRVVSWIQSNTTTVPTPRSWEMKQKQIVNILYEWICFCNENYYWYVPGNRSQVIFMNSKKHEVLEVFVDSLRRDSARGVVAPHQIILLMVFQKVILDNNDLDIHEIIKLFNQLWDSNSDKIDSKSSCNVGMPLKAFINADFIVINTIGEIQDYRNINELKSKIKSIRLCSSVKKILLLDGSYEYLESRVNIN